MGCCAARDNPKKEIEKFSSDIYKKVPQEKIPIHLSPVLSQLLIEADDLQINQLSYYQDSHAEMLLAYCEKINTWIPVKEVDWMLVEKINTSEFNQDYPMTHTKIRFPTVIPLALLLQQLNSPDHRPLWDSHVKTMEIISGDLFSEYFLYRTLSVFLYKADFVDKKIIGLVKDQVVIIGYGVEGKKEIEKGFTRALTIMSIHKISIENGITVMENYSQTDAKSQIAKTFAGFGPGKLFDWGRALINRVKLMQIG